jgi:hypothetical protein
MSLIKTTTQRVAITLGLALLLVTVLFPPFSVEKRASSEQRRESGKAWTSQIQYHFIASESPSSGVFYRLNIPILLTQVVIIAFATGAAVWILAARQAGRG